MVKAVIFDMDGLLIDSEPLWQKAFTQAFKEAGVQITDEDMREVRGRRQIETIEHFIRKFNLKNVPKDNMMKSVIDHMKELIETECKLLPGVKETFEICQQAELPMAIASSTVSELIDVVVKKFEIDHYFDHIYSAEYEPYGKPHPGTFITAAEKLGVEPVDCLVFEDAPGGVLAAKSAKMKCIAVPEAAAKDDKFIQTADIILDSLEEFNQEMLESS